MSKCDKNLPSSNFPRKEAETRKVLGQGPVGLGTLLGGGKPEVFVAKQFKKMKTANKSEND